jgi:hypothetical protein
MKRFGILLCILLFALAAWPVSVWAQYPYWKYDRLIEANAGHQASSPSVAVSGAKAVAVWIQEYGGIPRVYSNYSTNGGATWHTAKLIEDNAGYMAGEVQVALSGSNAVAVWTQDVGYMKVHANYSTDGGATWHTDRLIEYPAGTQSGSVRVMMSGTRVLATWTHEYSGALHTYFNASQDGGKTWRDYPLQIETTTTHESKYPSGAVSGSNMVVVWSRSDGFNQRVFYNASSNGGLNWRGEATLGHAGYDVYNPKVALSGTSAVAVWEQKSSTGNWRIYSSYSTDAGQTWHADKLVADLGTADQNKPQVVMTGSSAVVTWRQSDPVSPALIDSCFSTDGGANWSTAQALETGNVYPADDPQLALSGSRVASIWAESDGIATRIFANFSPNKGATWRSVRKVDGLSGANGSYPQVALSSSAIVAVWRVFDGSNSRIAANNATFTATQKDKLKPPKLVSPANGATGVATGVSFQWTDTNSLPQERKVKLRLKPAGGVYKTFTVPANYVSYFISGLTRGKTYSWNVMAVGNGTNILNSTWANGGVDWKFTTQF